MRDRPGMVRSGLIAVGRTALSCYVLQNLPAGGPLELLVHRLYAR
nr:hypothetical protein [Amycolatopsis sp. WAC 04182]